MTQVIGHQGAPHVAPANTVAAFRAARRLGADGVELDVRLTADGSLAVHHDADLPDGRPVATTAQSDLPAGVADLDAALDACAGLAVVDVEIKTSSAGGDVAADGRLVRAVAETLRARPAAARETFLVSCFHLPTLDRFHELAPQVPTGWLTLGFADPVDDLARVAGRGHTAVHPHHGTVDAEVVKLAADAGLAVNTWTCDLPDRIRWLSSVGVSSVITNDVAAARAALAATPTARP